MTCLGQPERWLAWAPLFLFSALVSGNAFGQTETTSEETQPAAVGEDPEKPASPVVDLEEEDDDETSTPSAEPTLLSDTKAPDKAGTGTPPKASRTKKSPAPAAKRAKPVHPKIDYSKLPWTYHQERFDLGVGLGVGWINDPAFDLFQTNNAHASLRAHGAYSFFSDGPLSIAVALRYESWGAHGEARELPTALRAHTMLMGGEARYHLEPRVYVYGRLDLGAWLAQSYLGEAGDPMRMSLEDIGFSGALSLGAAVRVAGSPDGRSRAPRVHIFAEGGLAYDSPLSLVYEMSEAGALRPAPVDFGSLFMGGPRLGLGAMVSY